MTPAGGLRLLVGVLLGMALGADLLVGDLSVMGACWLLLFPYLFLFLIADGLIGKHRLSDAQVFLLGSAFSLLYLGVYTKEMQSGLALSGIDWVAVMGGPLEWGMRLVLWFHCLSALFARREEPLESNWAVGVVVGLIGALAVFILLFKSYFGYYQAERLLGALWPMTDVFLLGLAWLLWSRLRLSIARAARSSTYRYQNPLWVWVVAASGLWLLGSGLLARLAEGFELPPPLFYSVQAAWSLGLGVFGYTSWRDRAAFDDAPKRRSSALLAAAGLRILGTLVLLKLFGAASENPRAGFWGSLLVDLPSKLLFYYAFLTSRLEV